MNPNLIYFYVGVLGGNMNGFHRRNCDWFKCANYFNDVEKKRSAFETAMNVILECARLYKLNLSDSSEGNISFNIILDILARKCHGTVVDTKILMKFLHHHKFLTQNDEAITDFRDPSRKVRFDFMIDNPQ